MPSRNEGGQGKPLARLAESGGYGEGVGFVGLEPETFGSTHPEPRHAGEDGEMIRLQPCRDMDAEMRHCSGGKIRLAEVEGMHVVVIPADAVPVLTAECRRDSVESEHAAGDGKNCGAHSLADTHCIRDPRLVACDPVPHRLYGLEGDGIEVRFDFHVIKIATPPAGRKPGREEAGR